MVLKSYWDSFFLNYSFEGPGLQDLSSHQALITYNYIQSHIQVSMNFRSDLKSQFEGVLGESREDRAHIEVAIDASIAACLRAKHDK